MLEHVPALFGQSQYVVFSAEVTADELAHIDAQSRSLVLVGQATPTPQGDMVYVTAGSIDAANLIACILLCHDVWATTNIAGTGIVLAGVTF